MIKMIELYQMYMKIPVFKQTAYCHDFTVSKDKEISFLTHT